jgi:2-methylcitrate dehydratase PrpD
MNAKHPAVPLPQTGSIAGAETISRTLASFAADVQFGDIPAVVVERAKLHILDALGVALASSTEEFAHRIVNSLSSLGGGGAYPVIGFASPLPIRDAVLANGALVHGIDFDDTHAAGVLHASSSALPMALAATQSIGGSGQDLLLAYLICVETASRIATAAKSGFHQNGFHPTGMVAPFGAVLGIGRLWGLTVAQMAHAQGAVLSMASGSFEFLEDGAWNKRLHPGWAVGAAIMACTVAKGGFIGATRAYEGRYGLFNAYLDKDSVADLGACTSGLGSTWEMLKVSLKPYPVCHYNHSFLDATLELRKLHGFQFDDIESINALISKDQIGIVCEPERNKRRPQNTYDARFSLHFALAAAVVRGRLTMDEISDEVLADPRVMALCDRIGYTIDPESAFPRYYSGAVEIRLKDGRLLTHREPINRGHPDNPLSPDDIVEKFHATASRAMSNEKRLRIIEATLALDSANSIGAYLAQLVSQRPD